MKNLYDAENELRSYLDFSNKCSSNNVRSMTDSLSWICMKSPYVLLPLFDSHFIQKEVIIGGNIPPG